jgi:hypothetical protein
VSLAGASGEEREPAERLDHEQVDEADEHDRRAQWPKSGPCAGFGTAHASTATVLLTATDGVLGTHSRTATAQPAELIVWCGERGALCHGKGLIADEPSHGAGGGLSRWAR